jgi:methyl-accepting chemotaxis protein
MKNFERHVYLQTIISNAILIIFLFIYSAFIVKLPISYLLISATLIIGTMTIAVFFMLPVFTQHSFKYLRNSFEKENEGSLNTKERTILLKKLLRFPALYAIKIFIFFITFSLLIFIYYYVYLHLDLFTCLTSFVSSLLVSFFASLINLDILEKICSKKAIPLVAKGIETDLNKYFLGLSLNSLHVLYITIPAILTNAFSFMILFNKYIKIDYVSTFINYHDMAYLLLSIIFNTGISCILFFLIFSRLINYNASMTKTLQNLSNKDTLTTNLIPTDLSTEFSSNMYLVNNVIRYFRKIYQKNYETGKKILISARDLSINAGQTSTIAIQQSSGIKEILSVMEDSEKASKNTAKETIAMADRAKESVEIVQNSFTQLNTNLQKMQEITEANIDTISGIKELSEKINSIWKIVTMIENIAEQTNIIAFNAELESSISGKSGQKFHIVANEIHRLASNTTDSVNEIKKRITAIQHASDNLIISSESGTEKIRDGCDLSALLETKFQSISSSSEITAESANEITDIVSQQNSAFEQIVLTIRQLATGVESFTDSTATVSEAAENLEKISSLLSNTSIIEKKEKNNDIW